MPAPTLAAVSGLRSLWVSHARAGRHTVSECGADRGVVGLARARPNATVEEGLLLIGGAFLVGAGIVVTLF